jgi:glycosyltransferase involved in cell wall biosynthesis
MNSKTIWVNGRYLTRKITGVERVAGELLASLSEHFLDPQGHCDRDGSRLHFKLAIESDSSFTVPDYAIGWEIKRFGRNKGHAWEQLDLANLPSEDWVLSLCNTGPMLRANHVIFFHDAQVYAIPKNFDWKFRWWYKALLNISGRRSQSILTNSEFSKSELAKYTGIASKKFETILLGCDHMRRIKPEMPLELLTKLNGKPYVLAVSSASPNKNFSSVLKGLELLGSEAPYCVIVGQQYSKVFKESKLNSDRVIEMGYVSDEALAGLYTNAMCLVFPSFYEGFGLPPLEAMLLGCPVIASNCSSLPEVCGAAALYCDPSDPTTIANSISFLVTNPEKVSTMRILSQVHAENFTWKKSATHLLRVLEKSIRI